MSGDNGEVENKVTCSAEDCDNFLNYEKHFKVPLGKDFEEALAKFRKDPSFENQNEMKLHACKWILTCRHESFKDPLWDTPKKTATKEMYDLQFEKDLKDLLVEETIGDVERIVNAVEDEGNESSKDN